MQDKESTAKGIIKALGLVFGDIGTSPIYTMTVVFLFMKHTTGHRLGPVPDRLDPDIPCHHKVCVARNEPEYRGEGGNIVLKEILQPLLKTKWRVRFVSILAIVSVALLIGDGVITPAISIMSAVEGSLLIPGLEGLSGTTLVLCSMFIAVMLFSVQRKGLKKWQEHSARSWLCGLHHWQFRDCCLLLKRLKCLWPSTPIMPSVSF